MDVFVNEMDQSKFKLTNAYWNRLRLNTSWSVGMVTSLINQRSFRSKEEWVHFYYESGHERIKLLSEQPVSVQETLTNRYPKKIEDSLKLLNTTYGRTYEALNYKGQIMYEAMMNDGHSITLEECQYAVRYRILGETWNGVVLRERNTAKTLTKFLKDNDLNDLSVIKTSPYDDYTYEVDYEIVRGEQKIIGLQVKPVSYKGNAPYLLEVKKINGIKNKAYVERFNCPVLYIYSQTNGEIENIQELSDLLFGVVHLKSR